MAEENATPEGEAPKKRGPGRPPKPKTGVGGVPLGATPPIAVQIEMARKATAGLDRSQAPRRRRRSAQRVMPPKD